MNTSRNTLLIFIASVLLSACVAPTTIASNKAENYTKEPKRIFVLTDVGSEFGKDFFDSFQAKLGAIARDCGAALEVSRISSLELDEKVHLNKMKTFKADTIMSVRRNGGTRNEYGIFHAIYNIKLVDVQTNKTVWRADTNFYRGGTAISIKERGEALAVDITNKIKEDKIFRSCEIIKSKT